MVREWLEELLPADAAERCRGRLHVVATHLPSLEPHVFGATFHDRAALINALCASVHVPWLLDGCMSTSLPAATLASRMDSNTQEDDVCSRGDAPAQYVDGHIAMALLGRGAVPPCLPWAHTQTLVIDHLLDKQLGISVWQFLSLFDYDTVLRMMDAGEAYAQRVWGEGCSACQGKAQLSVMRVGCLAGWTPVHTSHAAELVTAVP